MDGRVPDAAFTTSSGESLHSLAEVVAAAAAALDEAAAGSAGTEVGEAAASFVDAIGAAKEAGMG